MTATLKASGPAAPATASWNTGALTFAAGSLIVVFDGVVDAGGGDVASTLTVSDGTNTYTSQVSQGRAGGFKAQGRCWTAPEGPGGSRTITFDAGASNIQSAGYAVYEVTGYNTTTPVGGTASDAATFPFDGAASLTLSSAPASDSTLLAFFWLDGDVTGTIGVTPGSGWTEDAEFGNTTVAGYGQSQQRTGTTSTSVDWVDVRTGTMATFSGCGLALEIKAQPSSAIPPLKRSLAPQQRMVA